MKQTYLQPEVKPLSGGDLLAESQLTCRISALLLVSYRECGSGLLCGWHGHLGINTLSAALK